MKRLPAWITASLLAAPLVALTAWVARGAMLRNQGPEPSSAAAEPAKARAASSDLPAPAADLAADQLEERVDGGAEALRAAGCRRLLYWRFETPPADAEALVFGTPDGAKAVFAREAGAARTPGPGDEAQIGPQSAFFRRGKVYVRVFLDPGVPPAADLLKRAEEIHRALAAEAL